MCMYIHIRELGENFYVDVFNKIDLDYILLADKNETKVSYLQ